jgi:23S rRNA pseudouridine1911/1915/1917 synthase
VAESEAGARLDRFLADHVEGTSRAQLQKHIEAGAVRVDGAPPARGARTPLRAGQRIEYTPPEPAPLALVAEDIPLTILYEDEDLVVVDKPAGLVVHPALGHRTGTLVHALLDRIAPDGADEDHRPGIVHRLDRGTTGVMVVARHRQAQEQLVEAFRARTVEKVYLAVTRGVPSPPEATIDTLYGRHPRDRKRFSSRVREGKRAVSHYRILERFLGAAAVEVRIDTGRTHQIRVHLADRGHPLIGDASYGRQRRSQDPRLAPILDAFPRPALHARRLGFDHPRTGARLSFEAAIPEDLAGLLSALRSAS